MAIDCSLTIAARRELFHNEHGGDGNPVLLDHDTWWLYSDGAMLEADLRGTGQEPPEDPVQCCLLRIKYYETKLNGDKKSYPTFRTSAWQFRRDLRGRMSRAPVAIRGQLQQFQDLAVQSR